MIGLSPFAKRRRRGRLCLHKTFERSLLSDPFKERQRRHAFSPLQKLKRNHGRNPRLGTKGVSGGGKRGYSFLRVLKRRFGIGPYRSWRSYKKWRRARKPLQNIDRKHEVGPKQPFCRLFLEAAKPTRPPQPFRAPVGFSVKHCSPLKEGQANMSSPAPDGFHSPHLPLSEGAKATPRLRFLEGTGRILTFT